MFGITIHSLLAPSHTGARSPWSWVPTGMRIADKTRDIFTKQFCLFCFTHTRRYVKVFLWSPQQIPWVERPMPQPIPYRTTHIWRSDRGKKTLKITSWDWLIAICLTMDAFCDAQYKYEWHGWALWRWWRSLWRLRRLGFVDDEEEVLAAVVHRLVLSVLTFWRGPINESCSGGRSASEFMPYRRSYGRSHSYGMPSFALTSHKRLLLIISSSMVLPFHFHTWFLPFLISPFPVETHQSDYLWNPLHSLDISTNIGENISLWMKYLGLNKGEMSVKISLINSPKLKLDRHRAT
jgi:hypothetical protein